MQNKYACTIIPTMREKIDYCVPSAVVFLRYSGHLSDLYVANKCMGSCICVSSRFVHALLTMP